MADHTTYVPSTPRQRRSPARLPLTMDNISPVKTPSKMTREELDARDRNAVAYSKAELQEGDTLVIIKYPTNCEVLDVTGFKMAGEPFRVHSEKLLATGSKVFEQLFSDWEQTKFRRRNGYLHNLPNGIKYVLNLTPPYEGDEALNLTTELSCSPGIRSWFTAEHRCKVSLNLNGGMDEIAVSTKQKFEHKDHDNLIDALTDETFESPVRHRSASFWRSVEKRYSPSAATTETTELTDTTQATGSGTIREREDRELDQAMQRSKEDLYIDRVLANHETYTSIDQVKDYCPIRHRVGIEKLLQLIEGKSPRFDSAPKIWTLSVLAKYFDCTKVVVDTIVSWVLAEPNCQFIEILPEATLQMGFTLEAPMLARRAFAILVSEHALTSISQSRVENSDTNKFGRVREDLSDEALASVQAAAYEFANRVETSYKLLVDPDMDWFSSLAEYQKLGSFTEWVKYNDVMYDFQKKRIDDAVALLDRQLKQLIRGKLLWRINHQKIEIDLYETNAHRRAESYLKGYDNNFEKAIYSKLTEKERILTILPWKALRTMGICKIGSDNLLFDHTRVTKAEHAVYKDLAAQHGVERVWSWEIYKAVDALNHMILDAVKSYGFSDGIFPNSSLGSRDPWSASIHDFGEEEANMDPVDLVPSSSQQATQDERERNPFGWQDVYGEASRKPSVDNKAGSPAYKASGLSKSGRDFQEFLRSRDSNGKDTDSASNTAVFNLPIRSRDEQLLLAKRMYSHDVSSAESLGHVRKRSAKSGDIADPQLIEDPFQAASSASQTGQADSTSPSLLRRLSNLMTAAVSSNPRSPADASVDEEVDSKLDQQPDAHPTAPNFTPNIPDPDKPHVPHEKDIGVDSPFFSYHYFCQQVDDVVKGVANTLLSSGEELDFTVLTDTLLCLGEDEWKFLPLWAGGSNDGSGGVFESMVPPAPVGTGPSGPGPSYHTGYSTDSRASTEMEFDGASTIGGSINTSVAVENGYSDHSDRRRIIAESESDFHSEAFSDDTERYDSGASFVGKVESDNESYVGKGKGKAVEKGGKAALAAHDAVHVAPAHRVGAADDHVVVKVEGEEVEWEPSDDEEPFDFGEEPDDGDDDGEGGLSL